MQSFSFVSIWQHQAPLSRRRMMVRVQPEALQVLSWEVCKWLVVELGIWLVVEMGTRLPVEMHIWLVL